MTTRKKSGLPRCKNGTRRNKKTGLCEPVTRTRAHTRRVTASQAVSQLFEQSPATQQANYLSAICSDSNFCTTFGLETDRLANFFELPGFKYITGMRNIAQGFNGFVNELVYENRGYKTNAILKTPLNESAGTDNIDNVYYEGYIGLKYINRLAIQFPCFLKTWGIYQYPNLTNKHDFATINNIAIQDPGKYTDLIHKLRRGQILSPVAINDRRYDAAQSCTDGGKMALLIEYIDRPIKFYHFFSRIVASAADVFCELPHIFFQVYAVLAVLADKRALTHYDLHDENLLLYPIPGGRTVTMTYFNSVGGATVTFKTRYVVKLVDYGRCFISESPDIRKNICSTAACRPHCGAKAGYSAIFPSTRGGQDGYKDSSKFNQSIDLKVVSKQRPWFRAFVRTPAAKAAGVTLDSAYFKMLQKVVYMGKNGVPHSAVKSKAAHFRFSSVRDVGRIPDIWTVQEMYWALFYYLQCGEYIGAIDELASAPSVGTITCDLKYDGYKTTDKRPLAFTFEGATE